MDSSHFLYGASVTLSELEEEIRMLASYPDRGKHSIAVWSWPGLGKTTTLARIARDLQLGFVRYGMSTMDYIQLGGVPEILKGATGNKHAERYPIVEVPREGKGIYVLDDFSHAPQEVQNLGLELATSHTINDAILGMGWMVVLCSNYEGGVHVMQPALANRFAHYHVRCDYATFRDWATSNDLRSEVVSYLDANASYLYKQPTQGELAYPTPRSWHKLSDMLDRRFSNKAEDIDRLTPPDTEEVGEVSGESVPVLSRYDLVESAGASLSGLRTLVHSDVDINAATRLACSCVGSGVGSDFGAYLRTYNLISIEAVISGKHPPLASLASGEVKNKEAHAQVLAYALVGQLRRWWMLSKNNKVNLQKRTEGLSEGLKLLNASMQVLVIKDLLRVDPVGIKTAARKDYPSASLFREILARLSELYLSVV